MTPIYLFECECGARDERVRPMDCPTANCPECGKPMDRIPAPIGMVFMDGEGGYPSRRKFVKGSAPYTSRGTKAWGDYDPADKSIDPMHPLREKGS